MRRTLLLLIPVLLMGASSCAGSDGDGAFATLPPIRTTTTTTTTTTTISEERRLYVIKSGETLSVIAERFSVTVQSIVEINGISDPDSVPAGATIELPPAFLVVD
jgi:LysM repeat protein